MAVAFDAAGSGDGGSGSASSVSFSATLAASTVLFAGLTRSVTTDPSSVKWNTTETMTIVGAKITGGTNTSWCYYLATPTSGTHTFSASWPDNGNTGAGTWSFTGVDTGGTPYGTLDTWGAASGNPSGIDVSAEIGTGDLALGFCASNGNASITVAKTAGTSTERFIQTNPSGSWFSFEGLTDTAGTPTWTISAGDGRTAFALAINAAGGGGGGATPSKNLLLGVG